MNAVLLGIPDLLLGSKVNSVARTCGVATVATFTPHDLLSKAHGEESGLLLIDLAAEQLRPLETIRELKSDSHTKSIRVVGFLADFQPEATRSAESVGCDLVVSRSRFMEILADILSGQVFS